MASELPRVSERVVVLDSHQFDDNRISKHISSIKDHYRALRVNINFYRERSGIHGDGISKVIDFVPTENPYLNGSLMSILGPIGRTASRIVALMEESGIGKEDRTVLHVHDPYLLGLAVELTKRFPRSRIVYDRHEYYETWKNRLGISVPGLFERVYGSKVSEIVFVSRAVSTLPRVFVGRKVTVVPNYPESKRFEPGAAKDKLERFDRGGDVIAIYFGVLNLNFDRDSGLMFDVMRSVMRARREVSFEVAGRIFDPAITEMMDGLRGEFGERMQYLGEIPFSEVVQRTQNAHLGFFLMRPGSPMWSDDRPVSPNKVYEFLMSGTIPLVKANLDDRSGLERCAVFFEKEDGEREIVDALIALVSDRGRMRKMMASCLENSSDYSWEKVSMGYLECYERLFAGMSSK